MYGAAKVIIISTTPESAVECELCRRIVDRYCLVGPATAHLTGCGSSGSRRHPLNIYLMSGEEENTLRVMDATSSCAQFQPPSLVKTLRCVTSHACGKSDIGS